MLKKLTFLLLLSCSSLSFAQIQLPSFFGDKMVLQQNENAPIWGMDKPNVTIAVSGSWGKDATTQSDENGKWKLNIQTPSAGGPYSVTIEGSDKRTLSNVLIGEVWLCSGQSNMEMPVKGFSNQPINDSNETILNSKNDQIHLFTVKRNASLSPLDDVEGQWSSADPTSVKDFSATAYFFGKKLQSVLNVPIGLIHTSWGGSTAEAWMDEETLSEFKSIKIPTEIPESRINQTATLLYNAMIHPLIGYSIKGAIWYQGESNASRAEEYKTLFPTMIESWRSQWETGSFPFYYVQIAPFGYNGLNSAFLRESQLHTMLNLENTGMAVTIDIGDCNYIHPREKEKVGNRLAYWALSKDYAVDGVAFSGPVYKQISKNEAGKITLQFDYADAGLSGFGGKLDGFEVAGEDQVFHIAEARINGNRTLTVWSDQEKAPVSVRYAFKNCSQGSLFNTQGLPASSFRTDKWDK